MVYVFIVGLTLVPGIFYNMPYDDWAMNSGPLSNIMRKEECGIELSILKSNPKALGW